MSDPPASYYDSGQSLIRLPEPESRSSRPVSRPTTPPKRRSDAPPPLHPHAQGNARESPQRRNEATSPKIQLQKSPKRDAPLIDKPLASHKVLSGTSGPTFKQQSSGGSILKVEGTTMQPSEASLIATEEARRQQAAERESSTRSSTHEVSSTATPSSPSSPRSRLTNSSNLTSSSATPKQGNRVSPTANNNHTAPKANSSSHNNNHRTRGDRPLPPLRPTPPNQVKSATDIWEFDTPSAKRGCCNVM
jgi:hypothetical protein